MKRVIAFFASLMCLLTIYPSTGCSDLKPYIEEESGTVYRYDPNNIFGLEKIVVNDRMISVHFNEDYFMEEDYGLSYMLDKYHKEQPDVYVKYYTSPRCCIDGEWCDPVSTVVDYRNGVYIMTLKAESEGEFTGVSVSVDFHIYGIEAPMLELTLMGGEIIETMTQTFLPETGAWSEAEWDATYFPLEYY